MKEKRTAVIDKVHPELLIPPHIVGRLIDLIAGEWQLDSSQQKQLVEHLTTCSYCRTALIVLLSAEQKYERLNEYSETSAQFLLTQFVTIHHELEVQNHEQMGAYAEAIVAKGREKADKHFPILAEHIKKCSVCKTTLEETLDFLNDPEEAN